MKSLKSEPRNRRLMARQRVVGWRQHGAAIAELVVVLPALLMLGLGVLESALFYQAKTTVTYATFEAARKGATNHAQKRPMRDEFGMRIASIYGGDGSGAKAQAAMAEGQIDAHNPLITTIDIINPNSEAFLEFGVENPKTGQVEIPNTHLRYRDPNVVGAKSEVNVQDANLLKIQAEYGYQLRVPLVAQAVTGIMKQFDPGNARYYDQGRIPISAVATVRMQSAAWEDGNLNADGTAPEGGSVVNGVAGDPDQRGGDSMPGPNDLDGDGIPNTADDDIDGDGIENGLDEDADGNGVPDVEESQPEEDLCENPTVEEDNDGADIEDRGFWGNLWGGVKDALVDGYEFVKGLWDGIKSQLGDILETILHPIEAAKGLVKLGKMLYEDFSGTMEIIGDALGKDFTNLTQCGAFDRGRIIGEYASPAFILKLATKLSKFGSLTRSLDSTKKDFGCASFLAGTEVWTTGNAVPIEDVSIGLRVASRNESAFFDESQEVSHTMNRIAEGYHEIKTEFEVLKVTAEHPFWVQGKGWVEAKDLNTNDVVAGQSTDVLILDNSYRAQSTRVFNFSVSETPSYFVGESRVWVHNADPVCVFGGSRIINGIRHVEIEIKDALNGKNKTLNKPEANTIYRVNGRHEYVTDSLKRTVSVKTTIEKGNLSEAARNAYQQCKTGKCGDIGDEGGHLIANYLGGIGEKVNLFPQNRGLNRGPYKSLEYKLGKDAFEGKKVEMSVELKYTGGSSRPSQIIVRYSIDGGREKVVPFDNVAPTND